MILFVTQALVGYYQMGIDEFMSSLNSMVVYYAVLLCAMLNFEILLRQDFLPALFLIDDSFIHFLLLFLFPFFPYF